MKKTLTMILALVLVTLCSTSAFAQKHRHTDRNGGGGIDTVSVTNEKLDTVTLIDTNGLKVSVTTDEIEKLNQTMDGFSQAIDEFGQALGDYDPEDSSEYGTEGGQILGALNNTVGKLGEVHFFDYALLIPIIAVIGLFFAPVLIIAFILLYRYKRRKQRDQVVMAAINKGVEIPEEYRSGTKAASSYDQQNVNAPANNELMNKGIRRIVTGIGIWILGVSINVGILMGVGLFIVIYGGGELLIHYLNNRGSGARSEGTYHQQPSSSDSLQKHEGTYEKSE